MVDDLLKVGRGEEGARGRRVDMVSSLLTLLSFDVCGCVWSGGSWVSLEDKSRALRVVVLGFVIGKVCVCG